jgi:hypothetical protein
MRRRTRARITKWTVMAMGILVVLALLISTVPGI